MPEISPLISPESQTPKEASETRRLADAPYLAKAAFLSVDTVRAFYKANDFYLGRVPGETTLRSIIKNADGSNEILANGDDAQDTLARTLEAMHTLETVETKPIVRFNVNESSVSFTELGHYAPRVAPSLEAYAIPGYLEKVLKDDTSGSDTYKHTVEQVGWEQKLYTQVGEYVAHNDAIAELAKDLDVVSLSSLTPEQAVKLSLGIVQSVSKYTWNEEGGKRVAGGKREDELTTMELLAEGVSELDNPNWNGNGVCRNVASNVKAVFEALKANQNDLSMLHNTYAVFESNSEGYGARKRDDASKVSINGGGHAWNTFVTIGKKGESSITTVDATWAMGRNNDGSLKEPDYTSERMFETISEISNSTDDKADVAFAMSDYLNTFTRIVPGESQELREQKKQFALTEWLKVAPVLVEADMVSIPAGVMGAAYRLGSKLDKGELQTLFSVQQAGWVDSIDGVLDKYVNGDSHINSPDRFVLHDDNLQKEIFAKLVATKLQQYAERDATFRIRLREVEPGVLPEFDPLNNVADQNELTSLVRDTGLFVGNRPYGDVVRAALLKAANGEMQRVEAATASMSDYEILRNYRAIRSSLQA